MCCQYVSHIPKYSASIRLLLLFVFTIHWICVFLLDWLVVCFFMGFSYSCWIPNKLEMAPWKCQHIRIFFPSLSFEKHVAVGSVVCSSCFFSLLCRILSYANTNNELRRHKLSNTWTFKYLEDEGAVLCLACTLMNLSQ